MLSGENDLREIMIVSEDLDLRRFDSQIGKRFDLKLKRSNQKP